MRKYVLAIVTGVMLLCLAPPVSAQQTIEQTYGASFHIDGRVNARHQVVVQYPPHTLII